MKSKLQVSVIQSDLFWEEKKANLQQFEEKINGISSTDVIILPEMFTTGFTMNPKPLAEKMNGETVNWMLDTANKKNSLLIGSIIIEENENYYNRLIVAFPDGSIKFYDKKHLFTLANEHHFYKSGEKHLLIDYKGWKLFPLICYDLRFPVWARNTHDYDVLIYIASWPKPRIFAWDILLKARAIENMSYTIGVNRIGLDAHNFEYPGHSAVLDAYGNEMLSGTENHRFVKTVILDKETQNSIRKKLQFLNDKDAFKIL